MLKYTKFAKTYQICQKIPNLPKHTKFVKKYQICQNIPNLSKYTKFAKTYQICQKNTKNFYSKAFQNLPLPQLHLFLCFLDVFPAIAFRRRRLLPLDARRVFLRLVI
jgi:hypothetical protein